MVDQTVSYPPIVGLQSNPIPGAIQIKNCFVYEFTTAFGVIVALLGTSKTYPVPGLLTTDICVIQCAPNGLTLGANISNAYCDTDGQLTVQFTTAVALGVTLGSLTYRLFVLRP